jgi:hypothetical protein
MKLILRNLVLSTAALCASTAFAANQAKLNVPFDFTVKNHAYHAGSYRVEVDTSRSMVTLSSIGEVTAPATWLVGPGDSEHNQLKVRLTFDVVGQDHILRTIQYGELVTPNLNKRPKHNVEATTTIGE